MSVSLDNVIGTFSKIPKKKKTNLNINVTNDSLAKSGTKEDYHRQRLRQSMVAFWFSIGCGVVGFIVIVWSVYMGIQNGNTSWPGLIAGVITESVSVLFYSQSNKANDKISEFFKELMKDGDVDCAIMLAEKIHNQEIKDELYVKLSLHLSGIDEDKICKSTKEICNKVDEKAS